MAEINKGDLVTRAGYVAYFNEKVWGQIRSAAGGNIYHGGNADVTLSKDEYNGSNITVKASPMFSSKAYVGSNTTGGSIPNKFNRPLAIPSEETDGTGEGVKAKAAHLEALAGTDQQHFVISVDDINDQAVTYWTAKGTAQGLSGAELTEYVEFNKNLIAADVLYACCFTVIRRLIHIRPFKARWQHESSVAAKKIDESFNNGTFAYGVFIDNPTIKPSWTSTTGSGTWGKGAQLSYWRVTLGGSISTLRLTEASVTRNGVYPNNEVVASKAVTMVSNFWNAWAERCRAKNSFEYKFFTCHLNCHSSCHSSCHGSRSRR